jgi:hypothetical protein
MQVLPKATMHSLKQLSTGTGRLLQAQGNMNSASLICCLCSSTLWGLFCIGCRQSRSMVRFAGPAAVCQQELYSFYDLSRAKGD